jgi:catechol 2,3-dioxygenase-like lactoylglutathione lyase family enzyme
MTIELDHTIVSARDKVASARQLAELLGVPWAPTTLGPFSAVYVNEGLTLDFIDTGEDFPVQHFCFRVSPQEFDAILARIQAAGIPYRSDGARARGQAGRHAVRRQRHLLERARGAPVGNADSELRATVKSEVRSNITAIKESSACKKADITRTIA